MFKLNLRSDIVTAYNYINTLNSSQFELKSEVNPVKSIFKEYERVIVESIITSFGLDFLINDQYGGDVDTIHNVRQIGIENENPQMTYKNKRNQEAYENRGDYDIAKYHSDPSYKSIIKNAKEQFNNEGQWLTDSYTGNKIAPNKGASREKQAQLDHVKSSKSVHEDRGRVLADLDGIKLANSPDNLKFTNACLNNNMKEKSIPEYIEWCEKNPDKVNWNGVKGEPLPDDVKEKLMSEYESSMKSYESKVAMAYYTSPKFAKDLTLAAGKLGVKMGLRQAFGLYFAEIWFAVKAEFEKINGPFDLEKFLIAVKNGVKKGHSNAMSKHEELFAKFKEGVTAGVFSSVTTSLCNIFFTTAKNIVKIIRHSYTSIVQACEVLFINPQNYPFGERMRAVTKILATGASVVTGTLVTEALNESPVGKIPVVGDIVCTFCGTLVTGIMSCTLLYYLDHSQIVNKLVTFLNEHILTIDATIEEYRLLANKYREYAAQLMSIDIESFEKEINQYYNVAEIISEARDERELNIALKTSISSLGIKMQFTSFDDFMRDKSTKLVFE